MRTMSLPARSLFLAVVVAFAVPALAGTTAGGAGPSPIGSDSAAPPKTWACGEKGKPPCPMERWMKTTMAPAALEKDAKRLSSALDYVATHVPAGFDGWAAIARAGADKARAGDVDGARASCRTCHDQFKARYRAERRDAPF